MLLFRYAKLVLDYLPKHPEAFNHASRLNLQAAEKTVLKILHRLEVLKPRITQRYEEYWKRSQEQEAQSSPITQQNGHPNDERSSDTKPPSKRFEATAAKTLAAGENRDLAVQLARTEIRRRETARKATRQAGISWAEEQTRRTAGLWGNWEEALAKDAGAGTTSIDDDLHRGIQEVRRLMDRPSGVSHLLSGRTGSVDAGIRGRLNDHVSQGFNYPTVPKREEKRYEDWVPNPLPPSASLPSPSRGILKPSRPPEVPPKDVPISPVTRPPLPVFPYQPFPSRSERSGSFPISPTRSLGPVPDLSKVTSPPPEPQPSNFTFRASACLESGTPLRTIFLPPDLRTTFLGVASENTRANLETCGILCGTLISNAWFISRLVIPEQENTSDTCEMVNEGALFDYCDGEDLIVIGWIHTHPSQSCFMSSRDLHTHSGFQVSLPESIAIVCAPSQNPS